jgi:hypothetical protein
MIVVGQAADRRAQTGESRTGQNLIASAGHLLIHAPDGDGNSCIYYQAFHDVAISKHGKMKAPLKKREFFFII